MHEVDEHNLLGYLQSSGHLPMTQPARVEALAWGVSNIVLRVSLEEGRDFVVKQSRTQLRTRDPWFSRLDRIWRETGMLRLLEPLLPAGIVPGILFEDRDNYLFAMEAAPADHRVWKADLLAGVVDQTIAGHLGVYLATIHRDTALRPELQQEWGDQEVFIQLRVDPFYRRIAAVDDQTRPHVEAMIAEMFAGPLSMVHADFSPKNVLLSERGLTLVDFETGHYGDPAFDLGFFLSHLCLKTVLHAERKEEFRSLIETFWQAYLAGLQPLPAHRQFEPHQVFRRTVPHLATCMWARIDGTSKVDYLPEPAQQQRVRDYCRGLLLQPPADFGELLDRLIAG
jgi:5-methylthioribose kinase